MFQITCTCGECAKCIKRVQMREWRERNPESVRGTTRRQHARSGQKWKRDPLKRKAQSLVYQAIRSGRLIRQPCEVCGGESEAHHEDYNEPLEVRWLCKRHHMREHVEAQARKALG